MSSRQALVSWCILALCSAWLAGCVTHRGIQRTSPSPRALADVLAAGLEAGPKGFSFYRLAPGNSLSAVAPSLGGNWACSVPEDGGLLDGLRCKERETGLVAGFYGTDSVGRITVVYGVFPPPRQETCDALRIFVRAVIARVGEPRRAELQDCEVRTGSSAIAGAQWNLPSKMEITATRLHLSDESGYVIEVSLF